MAESKLAAEAAQAHLIAAERLSPEERLNAFLEHCQLIVPLHEAGKVASAASVTPSP